MNMSHSEQFPKAAYFAQSAALAEVQKRWGALEKAVREQAGCVKGRARYADAHDLARLQVDGAYPNCDKPELLVSVTHTDPDKPGHSNENKFHLKLGELYLFKTFSPTVLHMLAVGITQAAWAPYVLEAFKLFFDDVPFSWDGDFLEKIKNAQKLNTKNDAFWEAEAQRRSTIKLATDPTLAPRSALRMKFYKDIVPKFLKCRRLEDIDHLTMRYMAESSAHTKNERGFWFRLQSEESQYGSAQGSRWSFRKLGSKACVISGDG